MPEISIIVPVYNVEKYLDRCIESILTQTFTDFELILIDDGSPDNCPEMCDNWAEKDNRIVVIHKENGGVSSARNAGLYISKGNYIGFVDPDDVISPVMYENLYNSCISTSSDMAICNFEEFEDTFEYDEKLAEYNVYSRNEVLTMAFVPKARVLGNVWNKLYKKSIIDNITFDETLTNGEDTKFSFYVAFNSKSIVIIDNIYYMYYVRSDGAANSISNEKRLVVLSVIEDICNEVVKIGNKEASNNATEFFSFYLADTFLSLDDDNKKEIKPLVKKNIMNIMRTNLKFKSKILLLKEVI